jgi:hypothetical protein
MPVRKKTKTSRRATAIQDAVAVPAGDTQAEAVQGGLAPLIAVLRKKIKRLRHPAMSNHRMRLRLNSAI